MAHDAPSEADQKQALAQALLALKVAQGEPFVWAVQGYSMGPRFGPRCEVMVDPGREAKPGDVVLVGGPPNWVVHRVIATPGRGRRTYRTKGDQTFEMDPAAGPDQVKGVVLGVMREGRLWRPWHWRRPLCRIIGSLSAVEGTLWPHFPPWLRRWHARWRHWWHRNVATETGDSDE